MDVADIARFEQLIRRRGGRFTRRWFSSQEVLECWTSENRPAAYARRFAAKEAVWKALRLDGTAGPVPWRMITVLQPEDDNLGVVLSGGVAVAAASLDVRRIFVRTCVYGAVALAVATVEVGGDQFGNWLGRSDGALVDVVGAFGVEVVGEGGVGDGEGAVFVDDSMKRGLREPSGGLLPVWGIAEEE